MTNPPATYIAGVGASAGGLEAMLSMFAHMRPTGRIGYVVAQHMAKNGHDELVVRLIRRESALPVELAKNGIRIKADTVYVIPSGKDGRIKNDCLQLEQPSAGHISTPSVNTLFSSIAVNSRSKAIGILLSGTGSDGVAGCRSIKAGGGLTVAQDPLEAKFVAMPTAAIEAMLIDQILPVERIGEVLAYMFPEATLTRPVGITQLSEQTGDEEDTPISDMALRELDQLLRQVHLATSIDFSNYKEETLLRRLEKRKQTLGMATADMYQAHIGRHAGELHILQNLFLVSVSSFFRNRDSFHILEQALAEMVADKPANEPIRIWVPGCASGEEPYSIAIMLKALSASQPVEIIAADLNPEALRLAREGVYRRSAFDEMDTTLRDRYFSPKGQDFQIVQEIRACVRFEQRDAFSGPKPSNLDLVSCRNLLIYLKSDLQTQLVSRIYHALRPMGLLFIGHSESLSFADDSSFVPIDHYHRLFRRRI